MPSFGWDAIHRQSREQEQKTIEIPVSEIREDDEHGDERAGWLAIEDAELLGSGEVSVRVRYVDGGIGDRIWDEPAHTITVRRLSGAA